MATQDHCKVCFDALIEGVHKKPANSNSSTITNKLKSPMFVTWNKMEDNEWQLRGCIGTFAPTPVLDGLRRYAAYAAFEDTRFNPIDKDELKLLKVSVSLLINFEDASDWKDWEVGKHGITIELDNPARPTRPYSATYLPEVAKEQGWTHKTTLTYLVRKAGYTKQLTPEVLSQIRVTRYESSKAALTYADYMALLE